MENQNDQKLLKINTRAFAGALAMLLVLMILTYALTYILPAGQFVRVMQGGSSAIVPDTYHETNGGIPFFKWLASPLLVLFAEGSGTIIAIIAFLLVIGGVFYALDQIGVLRYMLDALQHRFADKKYTLLFVVTLFFMTLGAFVGSFEECVPLVPIAAALACCMGWDVLVGLGMSLLAVGCGFATGVCNPFTVGVAQELAGLPMFSGLWMRILSFVCIYAVLSLSLYVYAKKIEKDPSFSPVFHADRSLQQNAPASFQKDDAMTRALIFFCAFIGLGLVLVLLSPFVSFIRGLVMPLFALCFLLAGTTGCLACGMGRKNFLKAFAKGVTTMLPAVLLILMASSVRYTLEEACILDTILHGILSLTDGAPKYVVVLVIYALVLFMNFFIASGSAKAFLLMPLIAPIADLCGIGRQIAILAFAFGDGFSNVFYPTNPVLLISLSLVGVSYTKWAKWSGKIQLAILVLTCVLLLFANAVGYGL